MEINEFQELRFIGIWNDGCCSISLKFEIPSTFLGKNVLKITQKCPGNYSKMSWKLLKNVMEITQKCPGNYSNISWKLLKNALEITQNVLESPVNDSRHLSGNPDILNLDLLPCTMVKNGHDERSRI